jgi:hypothetical protein
MLRAKQYPDTSRPRGSRGVAWVAECEVDGKPYQARSRSGAPYALARLLVAGGVPDQPMTVDSEGLAGETRYRSIVAMAGRTVEESANVPVRATKYRPMTYGATEI